MIILSTAPNKESRSRKMKREMEEGIPSAEAVSEAKLKETPLMVLARWKTAAYQFNLTSRKLVEVTADMEAASDPVLQGDFKAKRVKLKRGSTSGQL